MMYSPFNFAATETAAHRRPLATVSNAETCEETAAKTCLVVFVGESLEHVFQDGYLLRCRCCDKRILPTTET